MPLSLLLLISLPVLGVVALLVERVAKLRGALLRRGPMAAVLSLSVTLSAASALVRSSGASGTGTRTLYGFPKPFYSTWISWEHPVSHAGLNWLYFTGNCIAWLALVSVVALLWASLHRPSEPS